MKSLLVVDDEPGVRYMLREVLEGRGVDVLTAASGKEALELLDRAALVLSDLNMPGMDGFGLLEAVRRKQPELPFILLTAHGNERVAVRAMKEGATDYLTKPIDIDELRLVVDRALEASGLRREVKRMRAERAMGRRLVAESAAMHRLLEAVERVADKDLTVLLTGETGSGKELVASLLHAQSRRRDRPLVRFNCAALPAELAEAELFGHQKGAFTGSIASRRGYFGEADKGTLVLDEIGELPLALQPKLLRAIQDGEIQPVGGRIEKVDVRVLASTHRDLLAEVKAGRFREDLYYRLAVVELLVPPLRERREEIGALATELAQRYGERFSLGPVSLSPELIELLTRADWPGNVRQLENAVARMVALSGPHLGVEAFLVRGPAPEPETEVDGDEDVATEQAHGQASERVPLRTQVEAFERGIVARTLAEAGGNQSRAAKLLGIGRATLIDKMKRYQIK